MLGDLLSFELKTSSTIWLAYAQFQTKFVLTLYAHTRHAWSLVAKFLEQRDDVEPVVLAPVVIGWKRWTPFELQTILLPARLLNWEGTKFGKISIDANLLKGFTNIRLGKL